MAVYAYMFTSQSNQIGSNMFKLRYSLKRKLDK